MRVWDCDPRLLCDKHLRAQHAEIHFAVRVIENNWRTKWKDVERFRNHPDGLYWLRLVHDMTIVAGKQRGMFKNHAWPTHGMIPPWLDTPTYAYLKTMVALGYPLTELNQGTPWERDGVTFEWYRAHEKDWTRDKARDEARRDDRRAA